MDLERNFTKSFEGEFECAEHLPGHAITAEVHVKCILLSFWRCLHFKAFTVTIFGSFFVSIYNYFSAKQ